MMTISPSLEGGGFVLLARRWDGWGYGLMKLLLNEGPRKSAYWHEWKCRVLMDYRLGIAKEIDNRFVSFFYIVRPRRRTVVDISREHI